MEAMNYNLQFGHFDYREQVVNPPNFLINIERMLGIFILLCVIFNLIL